MAGEHHSQSMIRRVPGHGPVVAQLRPPPRRPRAGRSSGSPVTGSRREAHGSNQTRDLVSSTGASSRQSWAPTSAWES
eukprot:8264168-Pyramimonas_sp.AAC.1